MDFQLVVADCSARQNVVSLPVDSAKRGPADCAVRCPFPGFHQFRPPAAPVAATQHSNSFLRNGACGQRPLPGACPSCLAANESARHLPANIQIAFPARGPTSPQGSPLSCKFSPSGGINVFCVGALFFPSGPVAVVERHSNPESVCHFPPANASSDRSGATPAMAPFSPVRTQGVTEIATRISFLSLPCSPFSELAPPKFPVVMWSCA